ncbi:immortalization up-regulated protein [Tenrec ecaudatus]|uniref:immortalization up-regulated protein n=1 Tax=Tenrec ecaudatus TaxID=94439 RepID=UPI003F5AB4D4
MEFNLAAALDSTSKTPQGTSHGGGPKHSVPKAQGPTEGSAVAKTKLGHNSSSDSSGSSSSSDSESKPHAAGSGPQGDTKAKKVKKPKVKKQQGKEAEKKAPH